MRRDLLQWDQALHLANRLAPHETPFISKEYGQQLEFTGNYSEALAHYERVLLNSKSLHSNYSNTKMTAEDEEHNLVCQGGIARMAIRVGDLRRGLGKN